MLYYVYVLWHPTSLLSFVLYVGDPPLKQEQQLRVGQIVLGVAFGLLCAVLALVLVCAAVTCLKLVKARKRSECNYTYVFETGSFFVWLLFMYVCMLLYGTVGFCHTRHNFVYIVRSVYVCV